MIYKHHQLLQHRGCVMSLLFLRNSGKQFSSEAHRWPTGCLRQPSSACRTVSLSPKGSIKIYTRVVYCFQVRTYAADTPKIKTEEKVAEAPTVTSPDGLIKPPPSTDKPMADPFSLSWRVVFVTFVVLGAMTLGMLAVKGQILKERKKEWKIKTYGKALIGGPWVLTDHYGKPKCRDDYLGQWYMIYFGFTHCPDVCPEQIERMLKVKSIINGIKGLPDIQTFVFSVDPSRDTPANMKKYLAEFSPVLLGFTGTEEQCTKMMKMFRVYASIGPKDEDNDYIVDHSVTLYLMGPDGEFVEHYGADKTAEDTANAIMLIMAQGIEKQRENEQKAVESLRKGAQMYKY